MKPSPIVVDANLAGAFVFEEEHTQHAKRVFASVHRKTHRLIAPRFWIQECGNLCLNQWRRKRLNKAELADAFMRTTTLPVALMDTDHLLDAVFPMAMQYELTPYDSLYVATAEYVEAPLVTLDDKLIGALRGGGWPGQVMHASEWPFN
jgi:predicted nucleic acid-binding protein